MKKLLFLIVMLTGVSVQAQQAGRPRKVPTKPATPCNERDFVQADDTHVTSLCQNAVWKDVATAAGGAGVSGPVSSTDNAVARFDGTGGATLQNSLATIDDSGSVNIPTGQTYKINGSALAKGDVGLGNVDNTSDTTKNAAAVALTNKTSVQSSVFVSGSADPADAGAMRLGNNEFIEWEKATPGADWTLGVNSSDVLQTNAPFRALTITDDGLTAGRVTYAGTSGLLSDDSGFTYNSGTHALTTTTFIGALTGNASSASAVAVGGITGLGTGVATALAVNVGSAGAFITFNGNAGTPSALVGTNITGTASGLTAGLASAVAVGGITGLGTGVATALAVNVGSAGAPVLFNGAGGTPSSITLTNGTNLPLSGHASQATNTIVGNATSGSAAPTALAIGTCSTAASALIWTTNTGFGCNTSITAAAVPASGITGTALASNVVTSSLTSLGTITSLTATTINAFTLGGAITGNSQNINSIAHLGIAATANTTSGINAAATIATTGTNSFQAFGVGVPGDTNTEYIDIFHNGASNAFFIVNKSGSGSYRALDIRTGGNQTILLGTDQSATFPGAIKNTGITTDATHTDSTVCQDTTTHQFYSGSGAAGICLGTSSLRFKNSIRDLSDGLDKLVALRPRTFFYNKNYGDSGAHLQYGFIAEEMKRVLPGLVRPDADGNPQSIDYGALWPVMVKAIQDLNVKVERLEYEKNATARRGPVRRAHRARTN